MTTSQTSLLVKPDGANPIPAGTLGYFRTRNRYRLYTLVVGEFQRSGLSQADLARRLRKGTDVICRWLRSPSNWEQDTVSDLMFAISGGEVAYGVQYPLDGAIRNYRYPDWITETPTSIATTTSVTVVTGSPLPSQGSSITPPGSGVVISAIR